VTKYIISICEAEGIEYLSARAVSGGDVNKAYAVKTNKGPFFLKVNSNSRFPLMFEKEAEGLKALQKALLLKVPEVVATGVYEGQQYFILEWLEKASSSFNFWPKFAEGLAELHRITHSNFGWSSTNYIGSIIQINSYCTSWAEFYPTHRIMPLVEKLYNDKSFSKKDIMGAEKICRNFKNIFPVEAPALLHGDLWRGNYMAVQSSNSNQEGAVPTIFDPAVYFGHREMDIGMSLLFGGFESTFYEVYQSIFPLENNWRRRLSLTQLYPLLVHALLFGGSYTNRCRDIFKEWN
jgi:fructosamine-3-kinase